MRATKSDSQFTSTSDAGGMVGGRRGVPISPSLAARPAFFAALARPRLRRIGVGFLEVAVRLREGGLALHHARAGLVAQLLHIWSAVIVVAMAVVSPVSNSVRKKGAGLCESRRLRAALQP